MKDQTHSPCFASPGIRAAPRRNYLSCSECRAPTPWDARCATRRRPRCSVNASASPFDSSSSSGPGADFSSWSFEFKTLCQEQLELLQATIPNVATAAVFFRREHPTTGDLEFIPFAAFPHDPRVWVSSGTATSTKRPTPDPASRVLPGGIPANWILPDYPFLSHDDAHRGFVADDGSLCVPIMFSSLVAGSLVMWRPPSIPSTRAWAEDDVNRVRAVARTIALAAAMEGRWLAASARVQQDAVLVGTLRDLIRSTIHQVRSPVTALVTFGRLLMRRLPKDDANRRIAKNIVVEGFRVDDLLSPLDEAVNILALEVAPDDGAHTGSTGNLLSAFTQPMALAAAADAMGATSHLESSASQYTPSSENNPFTRCRDYRTRDTDLELYWTSDIVIQIAYSASSIADARGVEFFQSVDDDAPPVLGHERGLREAVNNFLDNSLKYTPRGGAVGVWSGVDPHNAKTVDVIIWDTGPGITPLEQERVWDKGQRGTVGLRNKSRGGSGLGMFIARNLVLRQGGTVTIQSPIPFTMLAQLMGDRAASTASPGPGTLVRVSIPRPSRD
jgi:signal transduction histidine kinase